MKAAARMATFPPSQPRVAVRVDTNRCQFAQLTQQRFAPPRGWALPPPGHPLAAAADRGLKITAGFEILAARAAKRGLLQPSQTAQPAPQPQPQSKAQAPANWQQQQEEAAKENRDPTPGTLYAKAGSGDQSGPPSRLPPVGPAWDAYLSRLEQSGYFQGELQGSRCYRELLTTAQADFQAAAAAADMEAAASERQQVGCGVSRAECSWRDPEKRLAFWLGAPEVTGADVQVCMKCIAVGYLLVCLICLVAGDSIRDNGIHLLPSLEAISCFNNTQQLHVLPAAWPFAALFLMPPVGLSVTFTNQLHVHARDLPKIAGCMYASPGCLCCLSH